MYPDPVSTSRARQRALLSLFMAGSVTAHVLVLILLPGWKALRDSTPRPLTVELLKQETPDIIPPKPLPMETPPVRTTREPVKPAPKPVIEPLPLQKPILTAPPDVPPSPAATVVPEQKPAPAPEVPRQPAPVVAPAPVTPPRSDAAYLNNPRPVYPLAARRRGDQGTVLVRVVVTADGLAANVALEKSSGHPSLDDAALGAVKSWRFVPARQGGQSVESPYVVPVVFRLD